LLAAALPPWGLGFLLLVAWAPLLSAAARASSDKSAALVGAAFGAVYYAILFRWTLRLPLYAYPVAILAGAAYGAYVAAGVRRAFALPSWARAAAAAAVWTAPAWICDNPVRPFFGSVVLLTGVHAPLPLPLLQLARPLGEHGLVFFLVFVNALLGQALAQRGNPRRGGAFAAGAAVLTAAAWGWGAARVRAFNAVPAAAPSFRLACAQHDLPFAWRWRANHQEELFKTYEELVVAAAAKGANMVLFPQYQIPEDIYRHPGRWGELARKSKVYVALGTYAPVEPFQYGKAAWVMGLVFSPEGKIVGTQVALHPSPIGRSLVRKGTQARPIAIAGLGTVALLPCYDDVTSRPARLFSRAGADFLLSMANDGLFTGTIQPQLHMTRSRLRAVENDKHLVRCIPNGISAAIDPVGKVRDSLPEGKGLLLAAW
jgi:apolipoprotein N-acyltransferase